MLAIEHKAPAAGAVGDRAATWVIYDGKRVAKFQYVGAEGARGYYTLVPVGKSGAQPRTEYLTARPTAARRPRLRACTKDFRL
jgi:hypothetical protein